MDDRNDSQYIQQAPFIPPATKILLKSMRWMQRGHLLESITAFFLAEENRKVTRGITAQLYESKQR